MCGIVGTIGTKSAVPVLLAGLRQLEYRGYDSAGLATIQGGGLQVRKTAGRVADLEQVVQRKPIEGTVGISHTRWATHGIPDDRNAHPHTDQGQRVAVVHNGVIENYAALKAELERTGHVFTSDTDTEVIPHLITQFLPPPTQVGTPPDASHFVTAVERTREQCIGTYGLAIISPEYPDVLIGARQGSPLVFGIGEGVYYLASDPSALVSYTKDVVYLRDGELIVITPTSFAIHHRVYGSVTPTVERIQWEERDMGRGRHAHFMHKEIHEQPTTIINTLRGRIDAADATARLDGLNLTTEQLRGVKRIVLSACGTSFYAALFGEYLLEEIARIPVEVEYASELRYRNAPVEDGTILFVLSQSGETADTLAALKEYKRRGVPVLGLVNVVGSTIAREADGGIYLHAGPEIGVASTKAFMAALVALLLLTLRLGRLRSLSAEDGYRMIQAIQSMPALVARALETESQMTEIARKYQHAQTMLYLGRGYNYPVALEGALKLKEASYIHAEGYPAAEMKHGPIALVDADTPSVIINPQGVLYDKVMSNLEEIKARGGPVIAIATEGDTRITAKADDVVYLPPAPEYLQPLLTTVPLQLLAYHMAVVKKLDVDKPRNLAKSVTVE